MSLKTKIKTRSQMLKRIVQRFPVRGLRTHYDKDSDLVLWIPHRYPESWLSYLAGEDTVARDVALIDALAQAGIKFRIVTGNNIGAVTNSNIVYSIDHFNPNRVRNYSTALMATLRALEDQGNTLFPPADEAEYWENKIFMHRQFDKLGVRTPQTIILNRDSDIAGAIDAAGMSFPLIVKEPHSSNAEGVFKANDLETIESFRRDFAALGSNEFIVQAMLDMRRDLRVVVMGGEVVHQFWRINAREEWAPTNALHGAIFDFDSFPEQWGDELRGVASTLGLTSVALDVCWDGDDLTTEPYILEVSTNYTVNPTQPPEYAGRPFAEYKAEATGRESYRARFVDLVFDMHRQLVDMWGLPSHKDT